MQPFRKPNLSAPRYRIKRVGLIDNEYLEKFRTKHPHLSNYTKKDIKKIINFFHRGVWEEIIEYRDGIELPEGIGSIFIGSCPKVVRENVDYRKSILYGTKVTHKNYDTDGHVGKIFYSNYNAKYKIKDRKLWGFQGCRYFKRAVTQAFKENFKKYIVVDNTTKVAQLYVNSLNNNRQADKTNVVLEFYDEFDMN